MAGLVAVISHDPGKPVPRGELDGLVHAYADVRGDGLVHAESVEERALCAKIEGHVGGGIEHDGDAWCAAVGRIHSSQPLARAGLGDVDGQFAAVRYDPVTDRLEIFNDPFGMQALYVAERDGRSYVSTSAMALARHLRAAADPLGVALFLRTGRQFGPLTHWQGVRRLDPATIVSFSPGPAESTYWRPTVDERVRRMSLMETADYCAHAVLSTMAPRYANVPCLLADLTGGFDSRMVTAALARLGIDFAAQTSGESETADVRLAREVARVGGFAWHQEALPQARHPDAGELHTAVGWCDGALEILQLSDVMWRQQLRAQSCGLLVTGGGGEHFGHQPWVHEFLRAGRSREINYENLMTMRVLTPTDVSMLRVDPTPPVEAYAREVLARGAHPYADELNTTQLDAVYVRRTVGHFGAYHSSSEAHLTAEIPCYFKAIFSAGFSANHRYRNGHRLHRAIIGRINPAISAVETERGGPAQRMRLNNAHRFAPYYYRLARTAVRKVRGRSAAAPPEGPAESGYRQVVRTMRSDGVLDPASMRSVELYDTHALRALLDRAAQPNFGGWGTVGRVLTVELALRGVDGPGLSSIPS